MAHLLSRLWSQPILLLAACALMWAGNTVAGRVAVGEISPFLLTFLRWTFVITVLWPIYGREVRAHFPGIRPGLGRIALLGTLGFTAFNALYYAAAYETTAINMGILQGTVPVFVLIGAFLAHGTRVSLLQILGVLITLVGVIVVATKGEPQRVLDTGFNRGDLYLIVACVFYAFYAVGLKDRPKMSGTGFFTLLASVAALTSIPLAAYEFATGALRWPTTTGWLVTLWIAVFPSFLSQLFFLRGVDLIGPTRAGAYTNLVPVFSAILAVTLIAEPFRLFHAVALVLVIGGIWLTQRA
jgi:drug/metabolite transporter (DMT)-like permease